MGNTKVLIIGGSSLVGRYLLKTKSYCYLKPELAMTWYNNRPGALGEWHKLDVCNKKHLMFTFEEVKPDIVIHCASIGSVDYAEENYNEVAKVNINGLKNTLEVSNRYNCHFVYLSTNAVFSGDNPPYNEESPLNAVNSYGIIKRQAEGIVQSTAKSWLIIRPFMLYGWSYPGGRTNWAKYLVERLSSNDGVKLVDNHIWQPTYAGDLAITIWDIIKAQGIYNVAAPERATLYEFGLKVCDVFKLQKTFIQPVHSDYFPKMAKRPHDTSYDLVKLRQAGIVLSDIRTGLEKMKSELEDNMQLSGVPLNEL